MKKILYIILLFFFAFFPIHVIAKGYINVSSNSLTIEQGGSKTFTITAFNAIGDVSISSNNSNIASVNANEWTTGMVGAEETKSGTITVTGVNVGTTTITLKIDAATFDEEDLSGQTRTITVNVVKKTSSPSPSIPTTPSNNNNNVDNSNTNNNTSAVINDDNTITDNLSTNNNLKDLSVEGYELVKADNNNYSLTVSNLTTNININAQAEDEKATVTGTGNHTLNVGENKFEIIITSESGDQNKINIVITRKDGYYLEDLNELLEDKELNNIQIIIDDDTKITTEILDNIKESKKTVNFDYYDDNKKLLYSWIIDGEKIKDSKEFLTTISYTSEYIKEISKLSNYADGLYINFKHTGVLPEGIRIKLYVGDKFKNGNIVNIYNYNENKKTLDLFRDKVIVNDEYIEFDIERPSNYFVTMSNVAEAKEDSSAIYLILSIVLILEYIIIVILVIYVIKKKKKKKNLFLEKKDNSLSNSVDSIQNKQ